MGQNFFLIELWFEIVFWSVLATPIGALLESSLEPNYKAVSVRGVIFFVGWYDLEFKLSFVRVAIIDARPVSMIIAFIYAIIETFVSW